MHHFKTNYNSICDLICRVVTEDEKPTRTVVIYIYKVNVDFHVNNQQFLAVACSVNIIQLFFFCKFLDKLNSNQFTNYRIFEQVFNRCLQNTKTVRASAHVCFKAHPQIHLKLYM